MTTIKTYQLTRDGIVQCTGSITTCAEFAARQAGRNNRELNDDELDGLDYALRSAKTATLAGSTYVVEPITEEYDAAKGGL